MPSVFSAESDLAIASQVPEGNLLCICPPCVRQYGIVGNIIDDILGEGELAIIFAFKRRIVRPGFER